MWVGRGFQHNSIVHSLTTSQRLGKPDITDGTARRGPLPAPSTATSVRRHREPLPTALGPSGPPTDGPGPSGPPTNEQLNAARPKPPNLASSVVHEQERNRKLSGDLAISRALAESGLRAQASECFERNSNFESYPSSAGRCQRRPARDSPTDC